MTATVDELTDETDDERAARIATTHTLDEVTQETVDFIIERMLIVIDEMSGHPLYEYQTPFARRFLESLIIGDGATITALWARQSGKSETISNTIAAVMVMFPVLAKVYPRLLGKFKEGVWVGAFGPVDEQADNLYGRIVSRLTSERAVELMADPDIQDGVKAKGRTLTLNSGSLVRKQTAHPKATIEGRTYHVILIDECQGASEIVVNKSISPMATATLGTKVFTGTPTYCLDDETEILTKDGWKHHWELTTNDDALSVSTDTREIHWSPVQEVARFEVDEELIRWQGEKIDALSTPHHRWFIQNYRERHPRYRTGVDIPLQERLTQEMTPGKDLKLFLSGGSPTQFPEATLDDDLVELIGWTVTEGYYYTDCAAIAVSQDRTHNPGYCARLDGIAERLGGRVYEYASRSIVQYYFPAGGVAAIVRELAPRKQLTPQFLTSLSLEQAELLHRTLIDADGSRHKSNGQEIFIQKDEDDPIGRMNSFQMLSAMLGKATRVKYRKDSNRVYVASVYREKYTEFRNVKVSTEHYQGIVWCPVTVDGTWLARRNGVTYWTGNTKGVFYDQIQTNKREGLKKGKRQNHFEADWKAAGKANPNYYGSIQNEILRIGEDSDEFKLSYRLLWLLEAGMFTSSQRLNELGDVSMETVKSWTRTPVVVGIDPARKQDSTIVTVVYVDWDHPDEFGFYPHRILNWLDLGGTKNWETQYHRIVEFLSKYNVLRIGVDSAGVGDAVADRLRVLMPYAEIIDLGSDRAAQSKRWKHLYQLLDRGKITWPAGARARELKTYKRFIQEMEDLQLEYTGPYMIAAAPEKSGAHDDYSDSLAMACILTTEDHEMATVEVSKNFFYGR